MNADPSQPERCSPLDLASPVLLASLQRLIPTTVAAIEANETYSPTAKAVAVYEVRALGNNLRNFVTLAALESQIP